MNVTSSGLTWEEMWARGIEPGEYFDASECHPALLDLIKSGLLGSPEAPSGRALVPGCGRGYEVLALAESGIFETVTGLDLAETGVAAANRLRKERGGISQERSSFVCGDFFKYKPLDGKLYKLAIDYTFLCALPPELRKAWAQKLADVVEDGGMLVTFMFPLKKPPESGGPPHGVSFALYEELLTDVGFRAVDPPQVLPNELCHATRGDGNSGIGRWIRQKRS